MHNKFCKFAENISLMKKFTLSLSFFCFAVFAYAQIPAGYYNTATGSGYTLKTQLHNIIKGHTSISYGTLYSVYQGTYNVNIPATDKKANGKVWDMYSDIPNGTPAYEFPWTQTCGNYSSEGDCFNREHSVPQSWFTSSSPMVSDLFHVYPTDGKVNGVRSNFPYGKVGTASTTTTNGSKLGNCVSAGYTSTVFEPINEYKGDFARTYFYMATRYENVIAGWQNNGNANEILNGTSSQVFDTWQLNLLYQWHLQDPVSTKEINRNNAVYLIQNNRNPYIDHPEWVANTWSLGASPAYSVQFSTTTGTIAEGNTGNSTYNAVASISPTPAAGVSVTVQASLGTGTATSGTDFNFTPATLTFNATTTTQNVSVSVIGDTQVENNETVVLNLASPSANAIVGNNGTHILTITNDDVNTSPTIQFTATTGSLAEGNTGNSNYNASVSISPAPTANTTVQVTIGGTSTAQASDYTFTPQTLTFTPTVTSQQVSLGVVGDTQVEADETVILTLSNPSVGSAIGLNNTHTLIITNDDTNASPTVAFVSELGGVTEGATGTNSSYSILVKVNPPPTGNATVQVILGANTTAQNNIDFEFTPVTLNFSPTVTARNVSITIIGDNTLENDEAIELVLQNASGFVLGTNTIHTITLENDEPTAIEPAINASQIQLFPNPTQGNISFRSQATLPITAITVSDLCGKTIQTHTFALPTKEGELATQNLKKGIYIFRLQIGEQIIYKKIVKQ